MTQTDIVAAADYAEALLVLRRAKNVLFVLVMLLLLGQLGLFFTIRYAHALDLAMVSDSTTHTRQVVQYLIGMTGFGGIVLPIVLCVTLYCTLHLMLSGRLLGAGRLTAAFIWSVVLVFLLFPWQSFLNNPAINGNADAVALGLKVPGILYTWAELSNPTIGARFSSQIEAQTAAPVILHWARYVAWPIVGIVVLLIVQARSDRGLRQALGKDKPDADTTSTPVGV